MAKTRIEKPVTLRVALATLHDKGLAHGVSLWTLQKLCREDKIKHIRTGFSRRAKILINISTLKEFAQTLTH